jgi:hypothetical protein
MFLHIIASLPQASEASRGYLHGGILIDFVGQKAPTSKFSLLLLDVVVLGLQCFMLAVSMENDKIRKIIKPPQQDGGTTQTTTDAPTNTRQDHDAEERGVLRDETALGELDDIEMQSLGNGDAGQGETAPLLDLASRTNSDYENLGGVMASGNAILADVHVLHTLRTAWNDQGGTAESTAAYALQNVSYNATLAALAAQRRARIAGVRPAGQPT